MNQLLTKTWLLFYTLALSVFFILTISLSLKYDELEHKLQTEQRYVTKVFDSYLSSTLFQFGSMLELISYEYLLQKDLKMAIIDNILSTNPLLIGFVLFSPDGKTKTVSNTLKNVIFPNLLNNQETKKWFKQALTQDKITIGRPYQLNAFTKWIIPISKRIVDKRGNIVGIMTSVLDLQTLSLQWNDATDGRRTLQATLDHGFYRMLRTNLARNKYEQAYNEALISINIEEVEEKLAKQNLSLALLRKSGQTAQLKINRETELYTTLFYNHKHQLWISATESDYALQHKLISLGLIYGAFYLLFLAMIFLLFKWIVRIEKNKITELTYRAEHDLLTGLYNHSILTSTKLKYHKNKPHFSLLYIDLDHFKTINDSYGYSYGDLILIEVGKRIQKELSSVNGIAIHISADEFILLIEIAERETVKQYCQALLKEICLPYVMNNNDFKISASIGISRSPIDTTDIETLVSYANNSMLIAKKSKSHYAFFSEKIHLQLIKNLQIEQALHNALSQNEISLVYQPQLDNQQQLCGVEALVRWNNDWLGIISPDQFIPIAEEIGLMPEIGAYIMHQAMSEISTLQYKMKKAFQLSINVSARQFVQRNFFETLIDCLACYKSPYMSITVEITESLFIEDIERLLPIFKKMKDENISLSLDDFGTGYSSLSMLRKVPIDELKIDKSFVDHIETNKNDHAMVSSIITMGKNMGMTVLAEGVETKQQASILKNAGCDIYQGYYFSKPLNLHDLEVFIDQSNNPLIKSLSS